MRGAVIRVSFRKRTRETLRRRSTRVHTRKIRHTDMMMMLLPMMLAPLSLYVRALAQSPKNYERRYMRRQQQRRRRRRAAQRCTHRLHRGDVFGAAGREDRGKGRRMDRYV